MVNSHLLRLVPCTNVVWLAQALNRVSCTRSSARSRVAPSERAKARRLGMVASSSRVKKPSSVILGGMHLGCIEHRWSERAVWKNSGHTGRICDTCDPLKRKLDSPGKHALD